MVRKNSTQPPSPPSPNLILPRVEAREKLLLRVDTGKQLLALAIQSEQELEDARAQTKKWDDYNQELLTRTFDSIAIAEKYKKTFWGSVYINPPFHRQLESYKEGISNKLTALESIIERLDLIPEKTEKIQNISHVIDHSTDTVFIVHGHDETIKTSVARFVERLDLQAIILHEQTNHGLTIIEKFEKHASSAGFAIILLTPDDVGSSKEESDQLKPRARQNVIMELGYFCGALSRKNVCVLVDNNVEIPSDYLGVLYIPIDSGEGWKLKLAKEMKTSGLSFDMNKVC